MNPFEVIQPESVEEACKLLAADPINHIPIGGGTDLMSLIKDGIQRPQKLVSMGSIRELSEIRFGPTIRIGTATTLESISNNTQLARIYPSFIKAISEIGTQQIRNVATLGGNLCQRPRCLYFREKDSNCLKQGGKQCNAVQGYNSNLAIFDGGPAYIVHNSDSALPLIAASAKIELTGERESRLISLEDFFVNPSENLNRETVLGPGEIASAVVIPRPLPGTKTMFFKIRPRNGEDFALVNLAVEAQISIGKIEAIKMVAGNVAPKPYRVRDIENYLLGSPVKNIETSNIGEIIFKTARPLSSNGYKGILLTNLIKEAIEILKNEKNVTKEDNYDNRI